MRLESIVVAFFVFDVTGAGILDFFVGVCSRLDDDAIRTGSLETFGVESERLVIVEGNGFESGRRQGSREGRTGVAGTTAARATGHR